MRAPETADAWSPMTIKLRLPVDRNLRDFFCGLPEHDEWLRTRWSRQGVGQRLEAAFGAIATFAIDIRRMNVAGDIGAHWFHDVRNEHSRAKDSAKFQRDSNLMVHRPGQIDRHQDTADSASGHRLGMRDQDRQAASQERARWSPVELAP